MNSEDRKAAVAAYKERKSVAGIYTIRCAAGGLWVGKSPNLDTVQNRHWFTLRLGGNSCRSLQQAWNQHGADSLTFAIVERLAEEESAYVRAAVLKDRLAHWRAALDAQVL
jgi:hypothetical protein